MNRSTMLLLMCPIVAIAGQPTPPPDSATADQPFSAERWLTHVPSGEVDFDGRPLREVVAWLRDRDQTGAPADMNIVVNWRSLEAAGIDKDSEVTLHLKQVPLARILSLVLDQFSSEAKLGYVVEDNVLRIATEELLRNELVIRTYDVSGVDFGLRNLGEPPQVRLSVPEQTGGRGGRPGGHGDVLQGGPQGSPEPSRTEQIEQLVEVIRLTIEPESWEPGGRGTIAPVGLTLVVRNSPGVQEEIASLLARLSR